MDLRQLTYFVRVAESGGFAAASRSMHIAQSAISRQITALEAELGVVLFVRGRTTSLTPTGTRLLLDAKDILERAERLRSSARGSKDFTTIIVGSSHSFGNFLFPRLTVALAGTSPRIAIGFVQGPTLELESLLANGQIAIGIIGYLETQVPREGQFRYEALCSEQLHLVGLPSLLPPPPVSVQEALSCKLVLLPPGTWERTAYETYAASLGIRIEVTADASNLSLMIALARSGVGLALVPSSGLDQIGRGGELGSRAIGGLTVMRWIARQRHSIGRRAEDQVVAQIRQIVRDSGGEMGLAPLINPPQSYLDPA